MFKNLRKEIPNKNEKILLIGKFLGREVASIVWYCGQIMDGHSFQEDDYGIWDMTMQQINKSNLYWITVDQLIEKVEGYQI